MRVRLEDGNGRPVGMVEAGVVTDLTREVVVEWSTRVQYTRNTWGYHSSRLVLPVDRVLPWGPVIRAKWKARARLARAGLVLPYEPHEWETDV